MHPHKQQTLAILQQQYSKEQAEADLTTISTQTSGTVNATVAIAINGTASAVATALADTEITHSDSFAVSLTAGSAAATDLTTIYGQTMR